jgi:hypothetical protein
LRERIIITLSSCSFSWFFLFCCLHPKKFLHGFLGVREEGGEREKREKVGRRLEEGSEKGGRK